MADNEKAYFLEISAAEFKRIRLALRDMLRREDLSDHERKMMGSLLDLTDNIAVQACEHGIDCSLTVVENIFGSPPSQTERETQVRKIRLRKKGIAHD